MNEIENFYQQSGYSWVIGVDEAGRGPLAGPVVAAAVTLFDRNFDSRVNDSKKLTHRQRDKACQEILNKSHYGISAISEAVIDRCNILNATFLAMENAVLQLMGRLQVAHDLTDEQIRSQVLILVDGNRFKTQMPYRFETIVKGDSKVLSIACASILAKVHRDRYLDIYDKIYPQYQFSRHKGYPTASHRALVKEMGLSPIHRRSFRCV